MVKVHYSTDIIYLVVTQNADRPLMSICELFTEYKSSSKAERVTQLNTTIKTDNN